MKKYIKKINKIAKISLYLIFSINLFSLTDEEFKMINAVENGDIKTIQYLISKKINQNIKDKRGYSLIHIAVENNQINSINTLKYFNYIDLNDLLKKNTKITNDKYIIDASYFSAIDIATVNNNFEIVKLLLDLGANINIQMEEKLRSEFLASKYSIPKILELYLNKNIYLLMNSEDVISLIKYATIGNNIKNINYLVQTLGIDVDTKDTNTMLHYAISYGSVEALNLLIKLGANINNTNSDFKTPLHYAIENNFNRMVESIKILISSNANVDIKDKDGNTSLHLAVINSYKSKDYINIIYNLIRNNIDINILNNNNQNALNIAVENNNTEIANILINNKSNLNNISSGYAPIHIAIKNNNMHILENLLLNNAYINIKDDIKGYTPLCNAIENNNLDMCKMLIKNNALIDSNAINLANKIDNKEIKKLLGLEEVN